MFAVNGAFPQISAVVLMTLAARRVVDIVYAPYKSKKPVKEQGHRDFFDFTPFRHNQVPGAVYTPTLLPNPVPHLRPMKSNHNIVRPIFLDTQCYFHHTSTL